MAYSLWVDEKIRNGSDLLTATEAFSAFSAGPDAFKAEQEERAKQEGKPVAPNASVSRPSRYQNQQALQEFERTMKGV